MKSHEVFELLREASLCIEDGPELTLKQSPAEATVQISCEGASVFQDLLESLPDILKLFEEQNEKLDWFLKHISATQEMGYEAWCKEKGYDD